MKHRCSSEPTLGRLAFQLRLGGAWLALLSRFLVVVGRFLSERGGGASLGGRRWLFVPPCSLPACFALAAGAELQQPSVLAASGCLDSLALSQRLGPPPTNRGGVQGGSYSAGMCWLTGIISSRDRNGGSAILSSYWFHIAPLLWLDHTVTWAGWDVLLWRRCVLSKTNGWGQRLLHLRAAGL